MNHSPRRPSLRSAARCASVLVGGLLAAGAALAPAAAAWGPSEPAPVLDANGFQPRSQLTLRADGSAVYLARGLDVGSDDRTQLVVRPAGGPATFASPFASAFGDGTTTNLLLLSPLDAGGNLLAVRQASPFGAVLLAPGADPAGVAVEAVPDRISQLDTASSGEAVAIVGGGSTASVSFRAAGPAGRFDAPRSLDRLGQQRSYGLGITLDPDGGVLVVYRTEQAAGILQAYAPPGEDFDPPVQIDAPAAPNDVADMEYVQSDNGHGMLVWSEDVRDNSNRDQVYAAVRQPGGLLGPKSLVADAAPLHLVSPSAAGIADDGAQYIGILDAVPLTPCASSGNIDGDRQGVLAQRSGSGAWSLAPAGPGTWPNTSSIATIATAGNAVGVVTQVSDDPGARCTATDPATRLDVRLGQGAALGGSATVASEAVTGDQHGNTIHADGFAVNPGGGALLLTDEPQGGSTWKRFLYPHQLASGGGPGTAPPATPPAAPLPAPGRIILSGNKLVARDGNVPFEASCVRLGPGDKIYCSVAAIAMEPGPRVLDPSLISKAKAKRKAKKRTKPARALARAKTVKIAPGKRKQVGLKLNKLGKKQLEAAGKKGLQVSLQVTIRKGAQKTVVERKVKIVAGKAKKKKAKRRR